MTGPVDLPPPAGVGGELGGAPDAGADAGAQLRVLVGDLKHDRVRGRAREAVLGGFGPPAGQVHRCSLGHRRVNDREQREVDVEGVGDAPGPDPSTVGRGRFAGPAFQEEFASRGVLAGAVAGEGMEPSACPPFASASPKAIRYVRSSYSAHPEWILNS